MPNVIRLDPKTHENIRSALFSSTSEHVVFALASAVHDDHGVEFDVQDIEVMGSADYEAQSMYHVSLTDQAQGRVIKMAWDRRLALIEFHAHGASTHPAAFSFTDRKGFEEWVPHLWWRLKKMPYAAVVLAPRDFDALVWRTAPTAPEGLDKLLVGRRTLRPTNTTLTLLEDDDGRRQVS